MGSRCLASDKNTTVRFKSEREKLLDSEARGFMFDLDPQKRMSCDKPAVHLTSCLRESVVISNHTGQRCELNVNKDDCETLNLKHDEAQVPSRKRNRESVRKMLNWITGIARDPCTSLIGQLQEQTHGHENLQNHVLWAREKLLLKRNFESHAEKCSWQKLQKMHPSLYDDHIGSNYNLRDRLQCVRKPSFSHSIERASPIGSQMATNSCNDVHCDSESNEKLAFDYPPEKCIPVGPRFQASVLDWTGVVSESDTKWVGTQVWPLINPRNNLVIEREPIGKGRQDSCGCQFPKSIECIRFHCSERRKRIKLELGLAFNAWDFDKMGESNLFLTKEEEKKFRDVIKSRKSFWDDVPKYFPTRKREDIVNYYYNVFLLQRRAHQNRVAPHDINSADEESENELPTKGCGDQVSSSPNSALYSTKKQRKS